VAGQETEVVGLTVVLRLKLQNVRKGAEVGGSLESKGFWVIGFWNMEPHKQ
jgi:hypothetical protein